MDASAHGEKQIYQRQAGRLAATSKVGFEALGGAPERALIPKDAAEERWYVVHTQPRQETRAIEQLARQEFHTFCPCTRRVIRHARRRTTTMVPLFPNYIFVRLDISCDPWRKVNGTRGVVRLIASGDNPLPVPRGVVEDLQAKMNADGVMDWASSLKIGARVRISSGPFADIVGILEHLDATGRVRVLLDLLGRSVCVALRGEALLPTA